MPENETSNTPGAAIGSIIVIIVLLAGAIYFSVDYFTQEPITQPDNTASSTPLTSSSTTPTNN